MKYTGPVYFDSMVRAKAPPPDKEHAPFGPIPANKHKPHSQEKKHGHREIKMNEGAFQVIDRTDDPQCEGRKPR